MLNRKYPLETSVASSSLKIIDEHLNRIDRINELNDSPNEYKDELRSIVLNSLKDSINLPEKQIVDDNDLEEKKYYTIGEVEAILGVTKETVYRYMDLLKIKWDKNQPRNKSLINFGDIPKLMDLARWSKENRGKYLGEYWVEFP